MDPIDRVLIERACERLVTEYCHIIDRGDAAQVVDLFSDDAIWSAGDTVMKGHAQLAAGFQARQERSGRMSRHVCQNFLCEVQDENSATGVVYLTLYRHDGEVGRAMSPLEGPVMVGEYRDRFVRTPAGWRIAERTLQVSFARGVK